MRLAADNSRPPRGRRTPVPVRLSDEGIAELDEVAKVEFKGTRNEGNRSAAVRLLMQLGMQQWRRQHPLRTPRSNKGKV